MFDPEKIKFKIIYGDKGVFPRTINIRYGSQEEMYWEIQNRLTKQSAYWNLIVDFVSYTVTPEIKTPFHI